MAEGTLALPQVEAARPVQRLIKLVPGILLLAAIGYLGKFIEQSISAYARANHLHIPNIEYVLWAILIGLAVSNTGGFQRYSSLASPPTSSGAKLASCCWVPVFYWAMY